MKVSRFEDLDCWQEARVLTQSIYRLTGNGAFSRDYGLRDQMRRASVSIMANIAEGFAHSYALFVEVQSHLYVAVDQN